MFGWYEDPSRITILTVEDALFNPLKILATVGFFLLLSVSGYGLVYHMLSHGSNTDKVLWGVIFFVALMIAWESGEKALEYEPFSHPSMIDNTNREEGYTLIPTNITSPPFDFVAYCVIGWFVLVFYTASLLRIIR